MHYLYRVDNLVNGKFYIGKRKHPCPEQDSYMGSGKLIKEALLKYGKNNFKKTVLMVAETDEEAAQLESRLVTLTEIQNPQCYNMHKGGHGGFEHINLLPPDQRPNLKSIREKVENGTYTGGGYADDKHRKKCLANFDKMRKSKKAKQKRLQSCKAFWNSERSNNRREQLRANNPMAGKVWVVRVNAEDLLDRKAAKVDSIPRGWITCQEWRQKRKKKTHALGKSWYSDGQNNYLLMPDDKRIRQLKLVKGRKVQRG